MIDANKLIEATKAQMQQAVTHLEAELTKVRAGRANPSMVESVNVDYYGSMMPLNQVANVSIQDARTIMIQPWEKSMLTPIEKAIQAANLGFNPQNDGVVIRVAVPQLTEDRRKDLVKKAKAEAEHAKVGIRNHRRESNEAIKRDGKGVPEDQIKGMEASIQKMTDTFIAAVDKHLETKEKEILTV
ncbi:ribosome recycling factor [soil metagenome]